MKMIYLNLGFSVFCASVSTNSFADNDAHFPKQWGLVAENQRFRRDVDDIRSETITAKAGADINWKNIASQLNSLMKRDAIVAVLDSGVDLKHPDIATSIFRNTKECTEKGDIDPLLKEDRDGNGLPGDCMGWNFAAAGKGNPRTYDLAGHGTHVAGIISSISNNKIGISGVSSRIKILPVRVIESDASETELPPRSEIFAQGIRYAADMNVDVINMSLGWPLSLQTREVQSAIEYALKKNISIVAAAGNNGHSNPTFPCSIEGVICVGASTPEGALASFSNFGGAVDLVAPGEFIYSLFPTTLRTISSGISDYEIKSGTSQSAPFVSAAVAILRTTFPGISAKQILARLVSSADAITNVSASRHVLHGKLNLENAIKSPAQIVVEPSFKSLNQIGFKMASRQFSFVLPVNNLWKEAPHVRVKISAPSHSIAFSQNDFALGTMNAEQTKNIAISGKIIDPQAHSEVPILVEVSSGGSAVKQFRSTLFFSRILQDDPALTKSPLPSLPGFAITDRNGKSLMRTVSDPFRYSLSPEYFITASETGKVSAALLRFSNDGKMTHGGTVEIEGATRILSITSIDANGDGSRDYMVQSLTNINNEPGMTISWFNSKLAPLYGSHSHWKIQVEGAALGSAQTFLRANDPSLGEVALPVFSEVGALPIADRYNDPFGRSDDNTSQKRIYFLNPVLENNRVVAQTRVLSTNAVINSMRAQLSVSDEEHIFALSLFPQSAEDLQKKVVNALFVAGTQGNNQPISVKFSGYNTFAASVIPNNGIDFSGNVAFPLRSLKGSVANFSAGLSFVNHFDLYNTRTTTITPAHGLVNSSVSSSANFSQPLSSRDAILSGVGAYETNEGTFVFYQSKQRFIMQHVVSGKEFGRSDLPIYRYSFIPGTVFNQMFYPVSYRAGQFNFPAFYTDNSAINRDSAQIIVASKYGLSRPMNVSVSIPAECLTLNPARIGQFGTFSFVFLCGNELRTLPMSF
jgi:hypothetical protein